MADSRHSGPLPQSKNNGAPGAQVDIIGQLKLEMLDEMQVQLKKYEQQITELTHKYEALEINNQVMRKDNTKIQEQEDKYDQQIQEQEDKYDQQIQEQEDKYDQQIKDQADKYDQQIKEQAEKYDQQIMQIKTEYARPDNRNKDILEIPTGNLQIFTNISSYNPGGFDINVILLDTTLKIDTVTNKYI